MSVVLAVVLTAVAIPPLAARAAGGEPPDPYPRLAALAPLATLVAFAGVAVAATTTPANATSVASGASAARLG